MNTKVNSLNEKQRKMWEMIRVELNYEDTDEDFNEFKDEAEGLHAHLKSFAQQQSMIVAPTSTVDLQRAHSLGVMNQVGKNGREDASELTSAITDAMAAPAIPNSGKPNFPKMSR